MRRLKARMRCVHVTACKCVCVGVALLKCSFQTQRALVLGFWVERECTVSKEMGLR